MPWISMEGNEECPLHLLPRTPPSPRWQEVALMACERSQCISRSLVPGATLDLKHVTTSPEGQPRYGLQG